MITFTSASGSEYIYDDSSGFVFPAKPVMIDVIENYDLGKGEIVKKLFEFTRLYKKYFFCIH